jgi:hypothetical protein
MQALIWPGRDPASRPHCHQQSAYANDRHYALYVGGEYVERLLGGKLSRSSRDQNPNFQARLIVAAIHVKLRKLAECGARLARTLAKNALNCWTG